MTKALRSFSEREFYLEEFRRRSIGIIWPSDEPLGSVAEKVVGELVANASRVVVMSPSADLLADLTPGEPIDFREANTAPRLWRALRTHGSAGLKLGAATLAEDCLEAVLTLRLSKVVWIQSAPLVARSSGAGRVSVVDLAHLDALLGDASSASPDLTVRAGQEGLLGTIQKMIEGGVPAVNVCAGDDLERELFTYAGAGMFFTRDRYAEVRPLAIDDYDPASDLIERGEADGFLVPRSASARDAVLAHAVGVFVEGRYLAGIGALIPHPADAAIEVASLFALTRYVGEGAGGQIVRYAIERAKDEGVAYLFSCTTSDRVVDFFEGHGFKKVGHEDVPKAKWAGYDPERRARVKCLRFDP
ncbi:MAG: GNAT family N-acetyltransferase [Myxococcota bacterium]